MHKLLLLMFIIFHIVGTIIWSADATLTIPQSLVAFYEPYMHSLSLWQAWNIFSPDPYTSITSTRAKLVTENSTDFYVPAYSEKGMPIIFSRFRKFNDNIISTSDNELITSYLIYLCKELRNYQNQEFDIKLQVVSESIKHPKIKDFLITNSNRELGEITCS
jgi:hypothetical protein